MAASSVDFAAMAMVVEIFRANAVLGTAIGAVCGAMTSFLLGRAWVFRRADMAPAGQLARYAVVAFASLGLNVLGEYLFVVRAGAGYLQARVVVAVLVANLWNYPLHKYFVFWGPPRAALTTRR
jgi:putative flippase GtrA